jgi:spore coat-associated protein N
MVGVRTSSALRRVFPFLLALVGLGAVLVTTVFSGASFSSASTNPHGSFAAGTLTTLNSKAGQVLIAAQNLRPGKSAQGTLILQNTSSFSAGYQLTIGAINDVPASPGLSNGLTLSLEDVTATPRTLYSGTLAAAAANPISLGTLAASQSASYRVTLAMPSTPVNAALQGAATSFTLTWQAKST